MKSFFKDSLYIVSEYSVPHLSRSSGTGDGKPDDVATFDAAGHSVHLPAIRRQLRAGTELLSSQLSNLELSFLRSFSVMAQSPFSLKTTMPRCRLAGISNLVSDLTKASNFPARRTFSLIMFCRPEIP